MFRRDSRDPIERPLAQFRQHLEQTSTEEDLAPDEELPSAFSSEPVGAPQPRTATWQQPESFRSTPAVAADRALSVVAANARWEGTLQTEGSLVVHGQVKGTVRATHDVTIAEGSVVEAEIAAKNVVVQGTVRGRIEASGRLEIHPSGQVIGEVQAPSLVVHEGARLSGKLKMSTTESEDRQTEGRR